MSSFVLKSIALICMFFDHTKIIFDFAPTWFRFVGRIAFIIFAYFIAEGCRYTRSLRGYFLRLLAFAVICEVPFDLAHSSRDVKDFITLSNTIFTLSLGVLTILILERIKKLENYRWLFYPLLILPPIMASLFGSDYGAWGVILILFVYLCKTRKSQCVVMALMIFYKYKAVILSAFKYILPNQDAVYRPSLTSIMYLIWTLFSVFLISLYNGKRGRNFKWLFYIAYPLHFVILYLISLILERFT